MIDRSWFVIVISIWPVVSDARESSCLQDESPHYFGTHEEDADFLSLLQSSNARLPAREPHETVAAGHGRSMVHPLTSSHAHVAFVQELSQSLQHLSHTMKEESSWGMSARALVAALIIAIILSAVVVLTYMRSSSDKETNSKIKSTRFRSFRTPFFSRLCPVQYSALPGSSSSNPASIPALVPTLVLPSCESRFAISIDKLSKVGENATLDVVSPSGKPTLRVQLSTGNRVDICLANQVGVPSCSIFIPKRPGSPFEIIDSKGAPYAMVLCAAPGSKQIIVQDQTVMTVTGNTQLLEFSVATPNGNLVATGKVNCHNFGRDDHLEIRVLPGADAVLVLAVILATALFTSTGPPEGSVVENTI